MEITAGNLATLFTALKARFMRAAANVAVPGVSRLIHQEEALTTQDQYPMSGLLGDLVPIPDELYFQDIWAMIQTVTPIEYAAGLRIRRADIRDDRLGVYNGPIDDLAMMGATHAYRNVAALLLAGFATAWAPDGQNVFSDTHAWPGAVAWDNLEHLPLTPVNFDLACLHLETRLMANNQVMGLSPKLLVVGPALRAMAETILNLQTILGTTNRLYKRCDLMVLPRLGVACQNWFVIDDDPYNVEDLPGREGTQMPVPAQGIKPILLDVRESLWTAAQTSDDSDESFERHMYRFKAALRYVLAIIAPWLIQASDWGNAGVTTTTR